MFIAACGPAVSKAMDGIMPMEAAKERIDLLFTYPNSVSE